MPELKLYILGCPSEFRGNHWRRDVERSAKRLGWSVTHEAAQAADPEEVVRRASDADLFLWLRMNMADPHGDAWSMLRRIEDAGTPTVGLHMDLYWGIDSRERLINTKTNPWLSCQTVYTADGGHDELWFERGVSHIWMPPAMDDEHFGLRMPARGRQIKPYVFVGTYSKGIHGDHRRKMLQWAERKWPARFKHYGVNNRIVDEQLNQVYAKARVALGDSAPGDFYWSDRIPTTMGRGGLLAHPRTPGMAEHGYDDTNMIMFDRYDFDQMGAMVDSMTDDDIANMRESALSVTWDRHMWRHRLQSIAETSIR